MTAIPELTVPPRIPSEAEDALDRKDGNDSTNDEFFNPQAFAEKIEHTARQISAQSAPGERSESVMSGRINNSQFRTVSTTLQPATLQTQEAPLRHPLPENPTHNVNNQSSRALYKTPPRGPLRRQPGVANVPTYYPSQQGMAQRGAPMGHPPPHTQMVPPFGPRNSMQQQPAGFFPPTPPHGMPPYHNAPFTPQGPPPGAGMPPMGPHGVPFQSQCPMPPPRMDMPPHNSPQGHPTNAPPAYMPQQSVGTPMYQPNGYIPQQQHQPGAINGNRHASQNSRSNSLNSNSSRKVRTDPLHGPVYAINQRQNSNASSGPRKASYAKQGQFLEGPSGPCLNTKPFTDATSTLSYDECPCPRCIEATRSVFVRWEFHSLDTSTVKAILMQFFQPWKPTGVKFKSQNGMALVNFHTDFQAVRAIQSLWAAKVKPSIPELGSIFIWYPLYSKHYTPKAKNRDGTPRELVEAQNMSRRLSGSSTQRRGSNPYLGQRPVFNNPNFGKETSGFPHSQFLREQQQMAGQPNLNNLQLGATHVMPYQPIPQRTLWVPTKNEGGRKSSSTESIKEEEALSPKTCPKDPVEEILRKEEWRSKPPSEEAIEDLSDEVAVADTDSNVSSQGARSIKICLPNETGSARSRSASPEVKEIPTPEQVAQTSPKVEARPHELEKDDAAPTAGAHTMNEDDKEELSVYKNSSEISVPVEEILPIAAPEQVQVTEEEDHKQACIYSKVASELTGPTETIDMNTVIRHKPQKPRTPIQAVWHKDEDQVGGSSELQGRFADLNDEFAPAVPARETESAGAATAPQKEPQDKQAKQAKKKSGKNKKQQARATTDAPTSDPPSHTPSNAQSRGPSRASSGRPESQASTRTSTKQPQSSASTTAESSSRSPSAMQNHREDQASGVGGNPKPGKKKKSQQKKRKQTPTAEASAISEGQSETGGSQDQGQDQGRAISGQESPKKKSKTVHHLKLEPTEKLSVPGTSTNATADEESQLKINEQQDAPKDAGYRANSGGSLRMKKNRSPTKAEQKSDQGNNKTPFSQDCNSLQTIFEPPSEGMRECVSPDANLFPHQKFAIDQAKSGVSQETNQGNNNEKENTKPKGDTIKFITNNARIGSLPPGFNPYPQLPPNTKPSAWSTIAGRSVGDDPFSLGKGDEDHSKNWMKDQAVQTPQKPPGDAGRPMNTSPTPSPEKAAGHRGGKGKSQLNAAAKAFTPLSSPAMSTASLRMTTKAPQTNAGVGSAGATSTFVPRATTGHYHNRGGNMTVDATISSAQQPTAAQKTTLATTIGLGDGKPIPYHTKKPSLPGQQKSGITDTRLVTPAGQILDPKGVEQPGPPTKEKKKTKHASGPAHSNNNQQQRRQQRPTSAQVAAAASPPAPGDDTDLPTLAAAVTTTTPRKQTASFARAASGPLGVVDNVGSSSSPGGPTTFPNNIRLEQRGGDGGAAAADKAEHCEGSGKDDWTTVGQNKKATGGKNAGSTGRSAATRGGSAPGGRGGGKVTQQGNNRAGVGGVGGRVPVGEERKGG